MRKHDVRKWLHAILDLLPVILIPVFMIYSHRHDVSSTSTYSEEVPVYFESNEVTTESDIDFDNVYRWIDSYSYHSSTNYYLAYLDADVMRAQTFIWNNNMGTDHDEYYMYIAGDDVRIYRRESFAQESYTYTTLNGKPCDLVITGWIYYNADYVQNVLVNYLTETNSQYIKSYQTITYDFEKDIMSAFMSNFNFTIDKYFNMGNVFNLNGVYQWFNTNIFGGNAPTVIYSVWNIALYEFVMDLLFLLYGLFMWFIDIVENIMNKPFKSIK